MTNLEEKIREYFKPQDIVAVYLFGSYAMGKARYSSDIDIGVFLDRHTPEFYEEMRNKYLTGLGRLLRKDIDLVILNLASMTLLKQVFSRGKCLLVKDKKKLAWYRTFIFAEIADMGYYRERFQSGFIRKLMEAG